MSVHNVRLLRYACPKIAHLPPVNSAFPGSALEVPEGDKIVLVINDIQEKFDLVISTQAWHTEKHISFTFNHQSKEPFDTIQWHGMDQILRPDHCVQNTPGAEFHPDMKLRKIEAGCQL